MPEGPAERGVEAARARSRASAHRAESMDGAEHSGSIEPVMAGRPASPKEPTVDIGSLTVLRLAAFLL